MYAGATVLLRQHPSDCTFVRRYAKRSTTPRRRSPNFCARNAPRNKFRIYSMITMKELAK